MACQTQFEVRRAEADPESAPEIRKQPVVNGNVCIDGQWLKLETAESGVQYVSAPALPKLRPYMQPSMYRVRRDMTAMSLLSLGTVMAAGSMGRRYR